MTNYILKLESGTTYKMYVGENLVSDDDLAALFANVGSAYFSFDFAEATPSATNMLTIANSSDEAVISASPTDGIAEEKNYKGAWAESAANFEAFELLKGVAMDESQLSRLVGKIKEGDSIIKEGDNMWEKPDGIYYLPPGVQANASITTKIYASSKTGRVVFRITPNAVLNSREEYEVWTIEDGIGRSVFGYSDTGEQSSPKGWGTTINPFDSKVIDSLTSTSGKSALAANQGRVLNDKIAALEARVAALEGNGE